VSGRRGALVLAILATFAIGACTRQPDGERSASTGETNMTSSAADVRAQSLPPVLAVHLVDEDERPVGNVELSVTVIPLALHPRHPACVRIKLDDHGSGEATLPLEMLGPAEVSASVYQDLLAPAR
jgi:hypothetical protein